MASIYTKFLNQDLEKQSRIINASMKEFAEKGYANASTNEIVKESQISKGLLFHYFKNKKQLFLFLFDYSIDLLMDEFYKKINLHEPDFFIRLRQVHKVKLELVIKYPHIFRFLETAYLERCEEVRENINDRQQKLLGNTVQNVFEGIDTSKFRDGLDLNRVMNIIFWTMEKYGEEALMKSKLSNNRLLDYEDAFAEADHYVEILKKCFYQ